MSTAAADFRPPAGWPGYGPTLDPATMRRLALIRGLAQSGRLQHMPSGQPCGVWATAEGQAEALRAFVEISVPAAVRPALAARRG